MSNTENEIFLESLQDRMSALVKRLTPATIEEFEGYVREGDLEAAEFLVHILESVYADDL